MSRDLVELTTHCIRCGFCLESCPTFVLSGNEADSPRGRIYLVRSAEEGHADFLRDVAPHLDRCLGCRNCETACPSGVEYGSILELARERLHVAKPQILRKHLIETMTSRRRMAWASTLAVRLGVRKMPALLSRGISAEPQEADLPVPEKAAAWPDLDPATLPPVRGQVVLLEGCAMRELFPDVHAATKRLIRRVGFEVLPVDLGCCGALHAHAGFGQEARARAAALASRVPPGVLVIVNSAGCGSAMKEYGHWDADLGGLASRIKDLSEFLLSEGLLGQLAQAVPHQATVTYHDACHLAHGQRIREAPRQLLGGVPGLRVVPLPESELCCGSAGSYNILQPRIARQLLDRKWENIRATGAKAVVLGNPGCHAWIAQRAREDATGVAVFHTAQALERALSDLPIA